MTKDFQLEIKSVGEDGTFVGMLSVYNVVDLGNDMVLPGAFTKCLQEIKGKIPMLWQHKMDCPIGEMEVEDTPEGLKVHGKFLLDVAQAREAYALVKAGIIKGLSIGYNTIKATMVKGVRHLKELRLLEGSVVTFPMNTSALIESVKSEQKADFITELERAQLYAMQWMILDALSSSLRSYVFDAYYNETMSRDDVITGSLESIDQFRASYGEFLPKLLDMYGVKSLLEADTKAGRRISAASRAQIEEAIVNLQALLEGEAASTSESTTEAAGTSPEEAAAKSIEPEAFHSLLADFSTQLKSSLSAQ